MSFAIKQPCTLYSHSCFYFVLLHLFLFLNGHAHHFHRVFSTFKATVLYFPNGTFASSSTTTLKLCCIYGLTVVKKSVFFYANITCRVGTSSFHPPQQMQCLGYFSLFQTFDHPKHSLSVCTSELKAVNTANCMFKYTPFYVILIFIVTMLRDLEEYSYFVLCGQTKILSECLNY